jgi:hypothetical protein
MMRLKNLLSTAIICVLALPGCRGEPSREAAFSEMSLESLSDGPFALTEQERIALTGEVVYVPVYSRITYTDANRSINLAVTLSVHNTDLAHAITLTRVDYFTMKGRRVREYAKSPITLRPLETANLVVEERDRTEGVGANFIVVWTADAHVSSPIAEAIMVSTVSAQGVSFTSEGRVVARLGVVHAENPD